MRILLLAHAFNSLTQRLFVELRERSHVVSVELDINDSVTREAVSLFRPDVIVAAFLKRAIPADIWRRYLCLVVHPGPKGDRGPSALDWAVMEDARQWGVTIFQANAEMDAGDIWASHMFAMRPDTKGSLYRHEVTEAAVAGVLEAIAAFDRGAPRPQPLDYAEPDVVGRPRPPLRQADRHIDWSHDDTDTVLRKVRASDGFPGVLDTIADMPVYLFNAHPEAKLTGRPGAVIARGTKAVCRATVDGAVWIGHLRLRADEPTAKLPAATVLGERLAEVPAPPANAATGYRDIWYEERDRVGYLHFPFYNGAMSNQDCMRLRAAFNAARRRPTKVIVLMGGPDFWSNGLHLNVIEAADSPADESWRNIDSIDALIRDVITTDSHYVIAAVRGNAGAGGVFMVLAADLVVARAGVVLNPHYKGMGNLFGSEYWTYLLPRRCGTEMARQLTDARLPMGIAEAKRYGLVDTEIGGDRAAFDARLREIAADMSDDPALPALLQDKRARRDRDEAVRSLDAYRDAELARMKLNFYGFDPSYHVARYNFVYKVPKSRTPPTIAVHRRTKVAETGPNEPGGSLQAVIGP
jgi:putative two-component system hydrogenase maturation factor HypX/HoxX